MAAWTGEDIGAVEAEVEEAEKEEEEEEKEEEEEEVEEDGGVALGPLGWVDVEDEGVAVTRAGIVGVQARRAAV